MSITDELRAWWVRKFPVMDKELHKDFTAIADRIDVEHERAVMSAMNDALYHANEEDMAELGWIRLPKDADGEPIHVGDELTDDAEFKSEGEVVRLMLEGEDWFVGLDRRAGWAELSIHEWHHYHAPTVEDVLTEFGIDWEHESDCEDRAALLKEYAAKLRLAEEDV